MTWYKLLNHWHEIVCLPPGEKSWSQGERGETRQSQNKVMKYVALLFVSYRTCLDLSGELFDITVRGVH